MSDATPAASATARPAQKQFQGSFRRWIVAPIVLTVAIAVILMALLNYAKFDRLYRYHYGERFALVLTDSRQTIERFLALGISLSSIENFSGGLMRALSLNSEISSILITNETGVVLARADAPGLPPIDTKGWLGAPPAEDQVSRTLRIGDRRLVELAAPIKTDFGLTVGQVVLVYSDDDRRSLVLALVTRLGEETVVIVIIGAIAASLIWTAYLTRVRNHLIATAEAVNAIHSFGVHAPLVELAKKTPVDQHLAEALDRLAEVNDEVAQLEQALEDAFAASEGKSS
jgi:hypothetical protein